MEIKNQDQSLDFPSEHKNEDYFVPEATSWTQRDASEYNIGNPHNGRCLIFYHERFDLQHLTIREYAETDKELLVNCFHSLGFDVSVYKDQKKSEIEKIIKEEAGKDHKDSGLFVCCISTHGSDGHLFAKDGKYPLRKIYEPFTADLSLAGKPKLFFIQACQEPKFGNRDCHRTDLDPGFKISTLADFLIVYSSAPVIPGYASYHRENGSWLVKYLHDIFTQYHHDKDLLWMITEVNRKVFNEYESRNTEESTKRQKKQVPCVVSTLIRDLYLR